MHRKIHLAGFIFENSQISSFRRQINAVGLAVALFYAEGPEEVEAVLERARKSPRPAVVCLKTDHNANFAIPPLLIQRFVEVYQGPTPA